jgi:dihydrofolate reductase
LDTLNALRAEDGGDIYLCGGGAFAGFAANHGMVDRIRLKVAPAALGSGVPLFEGLSATLRLERTAVVPYANGVTLAEYAVVKTPTRG